MQPSLKRSATSDDEDDLESLRLAALQSLKRQAQPVTNGLPPMQVAPLKLCNPKPFSGVKNLNKRGRGYHGGGRNARNGPYNNRVRNSNLISVQTIEPDQSHDSLADVNRNKKFTEELIPKLILPQDRYCNTKASAENKASEASSKFDRYNDSDNSESDSESEDERTSGTESPKKLERANSLEALMLELENEIHGESKPSVEATSKPKKMKKSRKSKPEVTDSEVVLLESSDELCASENEVKNKTEDVKTENDDAKVVECNKKEQLGIIEKNKVQEIPIRRKSKSPIQPPVLPNLRRPQPTENCIPQNLHVNQPIHNLPYINTNVPVAASVIPFQPPPYANFNVQLGHPVSFDAPMPYNYSTAPPMGGPNGMHSPPRQMFSPNRYERPISPLTIKTDVLNTISAPLSPRSAAFVLQNREIIERRKKSPRRSYSRSPSPEFRRSLSPRYRRSNSRPSRSPSPIRQRHSPNRRVSPPVRRISPSRRLSPSTRRLSPSSRPSSQRSSPNTNRYRLSPPKRPSPSGRTSPKRSQRSPQRSNIRNRLGGQSNKPEVAVSDSEKEKKIRKRSRSISLSLSPSPERFSCKSSPINHEEDNCDQFDLVLEARKRKFEAAGSVPTEGIIRLKPKANSEDGFDTNDAEEEEKIESQDVLEEELNEDELLAGDDTYIDFNVKVDDLFSDEESDSENEGRFKSNRQQTSSDVPVLPFTQLLNRPSKTIKNETIHRDRRSDRERGRKDRNRTKPDRDKNPIRSKNSPERGRYKDERERERARARPRSRSPLRVQTQSRDSAANNANKSEGVSKGTVNLSCVKSNTSNTKKESGTGEKRPLKSNSILKDRKRPPIVSPIESKKIEIKIRNPSKYEVESRNYDVANKDEEPVKEKKTIARKVEVTSDAFTNEENGDFDEIEPEIIIENEEGEDEDVVNKNEDAGDLRAQLSRKRAERQNKLPKVEGVSSRLLQNALQGAVFKKSKKSKSKKKDKEAAPLDGKLPIHLRLGIPGAMDIFTDSKPHKISRKRSKNRGSFDQV